VERPELTLVTSAPRPHRTPAAVAAGAIVLAGAGLATAFHADEARRTFRAASLAETALARTFSGEAPDAASQALSTLRARLRSTPLDATTRTTAASLLVETAVTEVERSAAAAQAVTSIRLVRSDEWIGRDAALVLARCGETDAALGTIASIFGYAPNAAAAALSEIEPFVPADRLERGIPATPAAWLAWSWRLRTLTRDAEADARLAALLARWPDDLDALQTAASIAAGRERVDELVRLIPSSLAIPSEAKFAPLFALRARGKAASGDADGARRDAAEAIRLRPEDPWVTVAAGDALVAIDPAAARDLWTRALFAVEAKSGTPDAAVWIHFRLARLDDREGRGASALRNWRSILSARPDNAEAKRRIDELTGGSPR
jgi:tetratricopeptide (TPR) repeat protein